MAHVFLPVFNSNQDWLLFSSWNMFSSAGNESTWDIQCGGDETFLFRDFRPQMKKNGVTLGAFYYLLNINNFSSLKQTYARDIEQICQRDTIDLVQIQLSVFDHIILRKPAKIIKKVSL
jgi:hypothetical protein